MSTDTRTDLQHKSADDLERDIAETRLRISRGVDDLAYRVSPEGIGDEVKGSLADTQQLTFGAIEGLGDSFLTRTDSWKGNARAFVEQNAVPVTLLGFGLAWLMMRSSRR